MHPDDSAGARLRHAIEDEQPLQIVGVINALCAKLAEQAGLKCLYLSGAGVANASLGLPDLGMTTLDDVLVDARRIAAATNLPLLVDCDTGWETTSTIARTVQQMTAAGVAAIHLEDQAEPKRCGHRDGKRLVSIEKMSDRIKSAIDARSDPQFMIMARTDAASDEGLQAAIDRSCRYIEAGADLIFAEALTTEADFRRFASAVEVPVLANMTEFGRSPLLTIDQLRAAGIGLALYPLTAMRTMNAAARGAYDAVRRKGTQSELLASMQSREELYQLLDYHTYEQQIDNQRRGETSTFAEEEEEES